MPREPNSCPRSSAFGRRAAKAPAERGESLRAAICAQLEEATLTARQLSTRLGLREKDVAPHLEHLAKSLRQRTRRLDVRPARCIACEYRFEGRSRFTTPSRCPSCSSERIEPPAFRIEG